MAEDERDEREDDEAGDEQKKAAKKKWIIIGAVVLLLVIGSVVGTLYALDFFSDESAQSAEGEGVASASASSAKSKAPAIYYPLKPEFVTNYEVNGRQRYVQLSMTLMLRDDAVVDLLELHMPAIRNEIVMLLRGQVYDQLQTPEGKELLRQQALLKIQALLEKETGESGVEQVLFTNMVMQ